MGTMEKRLAQREHPATDAIARIDESDAGALLCKLARRREAGEPRAGDENGCAVHGRENQSIEYRPIDD